MGEGAAAGPFAGRPTVAVLGLGLIGGSLARDLSALGHRVLGQDRDGGAVRDALAAGCIHAALGAGEPPDAWAGIEEADVVILALPVGPAAAALGSLAPRLARALVTDVGSTKRSVVAAAEAAGLGERFVGSHPLAGDHRSGWGASRAGLFRGAPVFLCPARGAEPAAVEAVAALWRSVGGVPRVEAPEAHDARMAWASHLPQGAASALGAALAEAGVGHGDLGPGGRDAVRLAASSPAVWSGILVDNADHVGPALEALEAHLGTLRAAVRARDAAEVERVLAAARAWTDRPGR